MKKFCLVWKCRGLRTTAHVNFILANDEEEAKAVADKIMNYHSNTDIKFTCAVVLKPLHFQTKQNFFIITNPFQNIYYFVLRMIKVQLLLSIYLMRSSNVVKE